MGGAAPRIEGWPKEERTPEALLRRFEKAEADFQRVLCDVRARNAWSDTFVDALCEPPEKFTFGGMFGHVMTVNTLSPPGGYGRAAAPGCAYRGNRLPDGIRSQPGDSRRTQLSRLLGRGSQMDVEKLQRQRPRLLRRHGIVAGARIAEESVIGC